MSAMSAMRLAPALVLLAAACGPGPTAPATPVNEPPPISARLEHAKPAADVEGFGPPRGEHLCNDRESVVLACLLESQGTPPTLISLCLVKGSPRSQPVLHARERVDGSVDEPFAKDAGTSMVTVMKMGDTPFSREVELRTALGIYGVEKTTDPKDASARPRYERTLTLGRDEGKKTTKARCDGAHPEAITDNVDAMAAYQQ